MSWSPTLTAFLAGLTLVATACAPVRNQAYQQIAHIQNDEVPYVWLYVPSAVWAYSSKLQNFKLHGELTYGFWNASEWR